MYQEIEEPVDVIAVFEKGRMSPVRFKWKERVYKISKVTGTWHSEVGKYRLKYYAVMDDSSNFFELSFDERDTCWMLTKTSGS
jgi:hypothetical protein